jgi:probable F420-dependent oxidoreductase
MDREVPVRAVRPGAAALRRCGVMKIRFAVAPQGASPAAGELLGFAAAVEASGFDGVWLSDLPTAPTLDPLLGLAMIAGRSSRLRLGANVVPLGRNPFLLAKELAQLDRLSDGRLLLSFVTGIGQAGEREALGLGEATRGEVLEEVLPLLRSWWTGEPVSHRSARWSFTELVTAARPVQDPLEVWLGGRGPKALARAGRLADGWLGSVLTPAEAAIARERIQAAAAEAGRELDPEHFGISIAYARTAPGPGALERVRRQRTDVDPLAVVPVGAEGLRELLHGYIEAGLSKFVVRPSAPVGSWEEEAGWLAGAILDLQT